MNRLPREVTDELREILSRKPDGVGRRDPADEITWRGELKQWREKGLQVRQNRAPAETWVEFHGQTIPGTIMRRQPDGAVTGYCRERDPEDPPPPDWTPSLELPGKDQHIRQFLNANRARQDPDARWNLAGIIADRIRQLLAQEPDLDPTLARLAAGADGIEPDIETQWVEAAVALTDPQAVARLKKWTGQQAKNNLQNHNLAMRCGPFLEELSRSNPGALAWWYAGRRNRKERQERMRHRYNDQAEGPPPPPWLTLPDHPGEIIAQVREEFHAAGGSNAGWKALTAQPADHVADLLRKESREAAAWVAETLAATNLPETEPAENPRKPAALQQSMLAPPTRPRVQPPFDIKLIMARLAKKTIAPGRERDIRRRRLVGMAAKMPQWPEREPEDVRRGLRNMGILAFRHFPGTKTLPGKKAFEELNRSLENIADYVFAEPRAAARATAWTGLLKASAEWHSEARLRREREQLAEDTKINIHLDGPWEEHPYFTTLDSPAGFTARLLNSAAELIAEAEALQHCVGSLQYAQWCADGHTRLFRLEPAVIPPGAAPQARATTVEIVRYGENLPWETGQHTGWRNRPPTETEQQWAAELLKQWNQAEINASALNQPPKKGKRK